LVAGMGVEPIKVGGYEPQLAPAFPQQLIKNSFVIRFYNYFVHNIPIP